MKKKAILAGIALFFVLFALPLFAQDDKPIAKTRAASDIKLNKRWKVGSSITIPPLRVQESIRKGAKLDVVLTASVGGGISFQRVQADSLTGKENRIFTLSPFTVLLSGSTVEDVKNLDISLATTLGFFNDLIMAGVGYSFGSNISTNDAGEERELSRWFFLLGLGVSFR